MNKLVVLSLIACTVQAVAVDNKQDNKAKTTSSPANTIQQSPKYEMVYQPIKYQQPAQQIQLQPVQHYQPIQQKPQYVPVQIIQRPYYISQQQAQQIQTQPHAMIIIAQPALVPQSLLYTNPTQQLLNYFHSNPQAKYQLLHGNYQQPPQQPQAPIQSQAVQPTASYVHPVLASPVGNYILAPQVNTQPQLITQPSHIPTPVPVQYNTQQSQPQLQVQHVQQVQQTYQQQQQQPAQLNSLAHLAQLAAQQYVSTQMKTAPAIVTGFEHFTPEQQAQIKAQLSTRLGSNYHAVSNTGPNQYSSKYEQDTANFVPSPQVKSEPATTVSPQTDVLKNRYTKKN